MTDQTSTKYDPMPIIDLDLDDVQGCIKRLDQSSPDLVRTMSTTQSTKDADHDKWIDVLSMSHTPAS